MVSDKDKRSSISVSRQTKNALDSIKHEGQSYDGMIQELVKFWKEKEELLDPEKGAESTRACGMTLEKMKRPAATGLFGR